MQIVYLQGTSLELVCNWLWCFVHLTSLSLHFPLIVHICIVHTGVSIGHVV
jgi:hypothetical protein